MPSLASGHRTVAATTPRSRSWGSSVCATSRSFDTPMRILTVTGLEEALTMPDTIWCSRFERSSRALPEPCVHPGRASSRLSTRTTAAKGLGPHGGIARLGSHRAEDEVDGAADVQIDKVAVHHVADELSALRHEARDAARDLHAKNVLALVAAHERPLGRLALADAQSGRKTKEGRKKEEGRAKEKKEKEESRVGARVKCEL